MQLQSTRWRRPARNCRLASSHRARMASTSFIKRSFIVSFAASQSRSPGLSQSGSSSLARPAPNVRIELMTGQISSDDGGRPTTRAHTTCRCRGVYSCR